MWTLILKLICIHRWTIIQKMDQNKKMDQNQKMDLNLKMDIYTKMNLNPKMYQNSMNFSPLKMKV